MKSIKFKIEHLPFLVQFKLSNIPISGKNSKCIRTVTILESSKENASSVETFSHSGKHTDLYSLQNHKCSYQGQCFACWL